MDVMADGMVVNPEPRTPYPEAYAQNQNPEPHTLNPKSKPKTQNPKPHTPCP